MKTVLTWIATGGWLIGVSAPASAAVITVTTTADVVNGADGVTSLREAFQAASGNATADEIVLAAGATYDLTDCVAGDLDHTAAEALAISGNGATIDQGCAGERVIDNSAPGSDLDVDGVTLTGTPGGGFVDGAGILTAGLTTLTNVTMTGLDAGGGAVLEGDDLGGGGSDYVLTDVLIDANQGNGIRASFGSVTLVDSAVTNQSERGITLTDGSPVIIRSSTVSGNGGTGVRTTGQGYSELTLAAATVTGNGGTGVACSGCGSVTVTDSTIAGNGSAPVFGSRGGGLHVGYDQDDPADAPVTTITNSHIDGNEAIGSGGGIRIEILESSELTAPPAQLVITGSTIDGNVADGVAPVHGGGIYVETGGISLLDSHVNGNRAGPLAAAAEASGGGIYIEELGVVTQTSDLALTDSTVKGNRAAREGGGIYWRKPGALTVATSSVSDNTAEGSGGGLFAVGADVTLSRSVVSGNAALVGGGVRIVTFFDEPPGSLTVTRSTLAGNAASSFAGAIGIDADGFALPVLVENSTVSGNGATSEGGGIVTFFGGELTLRHATVVDNTAPLGANLSLGIGGGVGGFGSFETTASIIALPNGGANCELDGGVPTSGGYTFADDASCALGANDLVSMVDPTLGPLADNGGPTPTRQPAPSSPVAGLVPPAACGVALDQRGVARPQGPACEAGAVEIEEMATLAPITGTPGDDTLVGTSGDDVILGLGGNDVIVGLGGDDVIEGGPGRDTVFGGPGNDRLEGGPGGDLLFGGSGDDELLGGRGSDFLFGGSGSDALDGGPGRDFCIPQGGTTANCRPRLLRSATRHGG